MSDDPTAPEATQAPVSPPDAPDEAPAPTLAEDPPEPAPSEDIGIHQAPDAGPEKPAS